MIYLTKVSKIFFVLCILTIFSQFSCTKSNKPLPKPPARKPEVTTIGSNSILIDIKALADQSMEGREPGTIGEEKAANYLSQRLKELGLVPLGESEYEHQFKIPKYQKEFENNRLVYFKTKDAKQSISSKNVLGRLPGISDKVIILSAHYDHMGFFKGKIYRGANDNASGVACILDVLKRIKNTKQANRPTIIAAFWSAEEMGFWGSEAFVKKPPIPLGNIKAVFNVDTIGNGKEEIFAYWGEKDNSAIKALQSAAKSLGLQIVAVTKDGHNSDQISFAKEGIPAVTLISQNWLESNQSLKDTPDIINQAKVEKASEVIYQAIKFIQ